MKRVILIVIACILVAALIAVLLIKMQRDKEIRAATSATEQPVVTATPEPTAVPLPPHIALVFSDADSSFREIVKRSTEYEYSENMLESVSVPENLKAVFVYLDKKEDAKKLQKAVETGVPVLVYNRCGAELPESVVTIENASLGLENAKEAMEAAIAYPPHDTPVRLFGVFSSENSEAANVWQDYIAQGKVLSKGVYSGDLSGEFTEWFEKKLEAYFPGMVDAVYCENPEYAAEIAKIMALHTRDDFEIFMTGSSEELTELAMQYPRILPLVGKYHDDSAAAAAADLIDTVIQGGTAENVVLSD